MKSRARAKPIVRWEAYSPALHIVGRFTRLTKDEDGIAEEQRIEARCLHCDTPFKRTCSSGLVTQHIDRFAAVHADCGSGKTIYGVERRAAVRATAVVQSTAQTEAEKAAIASVQPLFLKATRHFQHLAKVDAPEVGPDVLTPQRCREFIAIIVRELAPVFGVNVERLTWLVGQRLSLVTPEGKWVSVSNFLEGKWR